MPHIRITNQPDLVGIKKIYNHYVLKTFSTFEIKPRDLNEYTHRCQNIVKMVFPHLTAEQDNKVVGYTYASNYWSRSAYTHH